jgi:Ca2+-binding RTX toxin-like protein
MVDILNGGGAMPSAKAHSLDAFYKVDDNDKDNRSDTSDSLIQSRINSIQQSINSASIAQSSYSPAMSQAASINNTAPNLTSVTPQATSVSAIAISSTQAGAFGGSGGSGGAGGNGLSGGSGSSSGSGHASTQITTPIVIASAPAINAVGATNNTSYSAPVAAPAAASASGPAQVSTIQVSAVSGSGAASAPASASAAAPAASTASVPVNAPVTSAVAATSGAAQTSNIAAPATQATSSSNQASSAPAPAATVSPATASNVQISATKDLDAQKSDFGGKMTSFSKNGIHITVEDPDHSDHTPGTLTWIDTGKGAPGFGVIGNGNKGDAGGGKGNGGNNQQQQDTGAENVTIELDEAADILTVSLVDHGTKNTDDTITFRIYQEGSSAYTEVDLILDSDAPEKVTDFTFNASDYGDGSAITQVVFYSSSNLGGGHGEASFLIGGVSSTQLSSTPVPAPDPAPDPDPDSVANPIFIVGNNVDDVESSHASFVVSDGVTGDDFGIIAGSDNSDVLVGDVGGAYTLNPPPVDFNVVMMLDTSGSMYSTMEDGQTRLDHLVDAVQNLLADFNSYDNGDIMVHMVPFNTIAHSMSTFMVTDATDYNQAVAFLDSLTPGGVTNYESALQTGISWLESGAQIQGAITSSYFISDGWPNYTIDDDTGGLSYSGYDPSSPYYTPYTAMEEIQGLDGSNEIADIQALSDEVIGVGINIGYSIINLDQIDSDGTALNVTSPDQLSQAFKDSNPLNKLDPIGDDVINGGDGTDYIFGDALYTDDLSVAHNLGMQAGSGWQVFEALESRDSALAPNWSRADTVDYIKNNGEELMQESIDQEGSPRIIGNDTIYGGGGDDVIYAQEGGDTISGGSGNDTIYGGRGADRFVFENIGDGVDIIKDFDADEGDVLQVSDVLTGYDPLSDSIGDFLIANEEDGSTTISVDADGTGSQSTAVEVVTLDGVTEINLAEMLSNGSIEV